MPKTAGVEGGNEGCWDLSALLYSWRWGEGGEELTPRVFPLVPSCARLKSGVMQEKCFLCISPQPSSVSMFHSVSASSLFYFGVLAGPFSLRYSCLFVVVVVVLEGGVWLMLAFMAVLQSLGYPAQ